MPRKVIQIAMNGVTGRMGCRQHLVRSVLAIRERAACRSMTARSIYPEPVLVGRDERRLRHIADQYGVERWSTNLDEVLADPEVAVYFDAQVTSVREASLLKAIAAGKHVYTEKPVAESLDGALRLAAAARQAGIVHGVVHDKLFLPGIIKLRRLIRRASSAESCRCGSSSATGCSKGDGLPAQRPSWNYRADQGGGIVLDMFPHWQYLLEDLLGPVTALYARQALTSPSAGTSQGPPTRRPPMTRVRGARVRRRARRVRQRLVGGAGEPAGAPRAPGRRRERQRRRRAAELRRAAPGVHARAGLEPGPT